MVDVNLPSGKSLFTKKLKFINLVVKVNKLSDKS